MKKPLPEIVSRAAHPQPANTQVLAPFSTSSRPYLGGEVCYAEVATVTPALSPGDIVKPIPTAANRPDQGELLSKIVCSGQPSFLSKADFSYPSGAHTAMSGTTPGTVEGDVVVTAGMVNAQGEATSWSLSPHREKRRPLKPLHSSGATALARASSNPSLGLPSSSSSSSSSFSHKLRRRLQGPQEEGEGRGGGGQLRSVGTSATGPDAAAAAAAAIAAMVSSSSGSEDALTGTTSLPGRGAPLLEGSSPGSQPSTMHDQRGLREGEPSSSSHLTAAPDMSIARSISWSPFSSGGGGGGSSSSAAHTTGPSRATAAPRLRRGSSLTYFTSQMDAPYRNDSERRPGGGAHSPPLGKTPAAPSLRRASASPTLSPGIDRVRFPRRSPSLRGTLDADQEGQPAHTESEAYTNLFRSGSGDSDGAPPPPLLSGPQPPTMVLKESGRGGQGKGPGGVRAGGRATAAVGGLGLALSARQVVFHGQGENGGDSVLGVSEPSHASVENTDGSKNYRRNSHFGGKSSVPQGSSSRRDSRKYSEGHVSEGDRRSRRSSDLGCRRRDVPLGFGETVGTEENISAAAADFDENYKQPLQWDGERDEANSHKDQEQPFQASWNGNATKARQSFDPVTSTAKPINAVPEQAAPKSRICDVLVDPRGSRGQARQDRDREGVGGGGINLVGPSRDTVSNSSGGSLLVRRNDCILKSLFSGPPHAAAGLPGEVPSAGFSFEFGLWKKSGGVPSATSGPRGAIEAALPPPPLEGFPHTGLVAYFPRADVKDGVGAHENRGFSGRISLQAMSTTSTTAPFGEVAMAGRRSSPPPSRAGTVLAGVSKLATGHPRNDEWPLDLVGGLRGPFRSPNGFTVTRDVSAPVPLAEEFKGREGSLDPARDGTTPPALALRRGRPPRRRQSPPMLSPRLSPTAARTGTRPRAEASRRHESGSVKGVDCQGRLRGLKVSPPPQSNRSPSALRAGGGATTWSGEGKEGRRRGDDGSSTSSDDSMGPAVSRGHGNRGSRGDAARSGNLQIGSAARAPPLFSLAGGQYHTTRHGAAPNLCHGSKAGPTGEGVRLEGTGTRPAGNSEMIYIKEDASGAVTAPESQSWPEDSSIDHPERLSVEVSEDLSEESDSGARSRWSRMSAVSESYGEDSQWAADKEFHMCVSRNRRHHILWKRGEQIGMGSFGKVFKGLNESTGELFAVKQIELAHGSKEEMNTLETEIDLMKDLNHRHIVRYCGTDRGLRHLYIFLEYVPGGSIASMLQQFGVFRDDLVRRFVHQILLGMCYLHDKGIIHRDIKGANVLVTEQGIAKLADFGCSKQFQGARTPSFDESLQTMRGSVPWMAPEMVKQTGHGRSADVWSLGATMIEMYTARYPWPAFSNNIAAMYHVATCTEPPAFPENVAIDAKRFLSNCLIIRADKRLKASELLQHPFLHGAAEELLASSGQGPGGLGSSGGMTKHK